MADQAMKSTGNSGKMAPRSSSRKLRRNIISGILIIFLGMQFFQPDKNNNDVVVTNGITAVVNVPDNVNALLHQACYDCHSNNTEYPWYSNIQPIGWWLADHIKEGKRELNFDEFATYKTKRQLKKLDEVKKSQQDGWMPLKSYTWMHGDAKLTDAEKKAIINWADSAIIQIRALPVKE